ncbi:MAG TPA: AAA family ATPase [Hyphomicrobiaceae bacterium]|nr:AAA family ATPase [Hyphomicrobiaceae bacterium]
MASARKRPSGRGARRNTLGGRAAVGPDEDFALRWIREQIGTAERRQVTILLCEGGRTLPVFGRDGGAGDVSLLDHVAVATQRFAGHLLVPAGGRARACWGYPRAIEDDARLAVGAALEIVSARPTGVEVRCALDAGIVLTCGSAPLAPEHDGEETSIERAAAEMLSSAAPNTVLASEAVRRLCAGSLEFAPWPGTGSDAVKVWRVLGVRPQWRQARATPFPLFGREAELESLRLCWQRTRAGASQMAVVLGEAGIGKSALLGGLRQEVVGSGGRWAEGRCLPERRDQALAPVRNLMEDLVGPGSSQGGAKQGPSVDALVGALATRPGPVALVFEDVHWADEATLALIAELGRRLTDLAAVLVVCTARPGAVRLGLGPAAVELTLDRLSGGNIMRLLSAAEFAAGLPEEVRHAVAERSEGNPAAALELARLWHETGANRSSSEEMLARPSRLKAGLAARLDALGELKPLAKAAALIGREFDAALLARTLEMETASLAERLDRLAGAGIIARSWSADGWRYRFNQALLRDAALSSLPEPQRRAFHAKIARALTTAPSESAAAKPAAIAKHLARAGDFRGAVTWWRRAAEEAALTASLHSAVANLERALAASSQRREACTELEQIEILRQLGVHLTQLKGGAAPETLATYARALDLMAAVPEARAQLRFDLTWGLYACHLVHGNMARALAMGEALVTAKAGQVSSEQAMLAQRMHGVAKLLSGSIGEAIDLYGMALQNYDQAQHGALRFSYVSDQGAVAHAHLSWALAIAGQPDRARAHLRAALQLAGHFDHAHTSAHVVCVLATAAQILGDAGLAAALATAGRALANHHNFAYWSAWAGLVLGWTQARIAAESGARAITEAIAAYRATGAEQALPYGFLLLGETLLAAGRRDAAAEALERAWTLSGQHRINLYAAEILRLRALAESALGRPRVRVMSLLEQALDLARTQGALAFLRRIERTAGELLAGRDQTLIAGHGAVPPAGLRSFPEPQVWEEARPAPTPETHIAIAARAARTPPVSQNRFAG